MLAFAHQAHGGLLNEAIVRAFILSMSRITTELNARIGPSGSRRPATQTVAWAHILSMSRITTELNACIGPSGTRWAAARDCHAGPHTFNEQDHYRAKCSHRPIGHMVGCCMRLSRGPTYFQFNEQDHYRAKCSHWPIGIMAACCTRLLCGPTCFQ